MAPHRQPHYASDQDAQHRQHTQVFVEVLPRDRLARAQLQLIAPTVITSSQPLACAQLVAWRQLSQPRDGNDEQDVVGQTRLELCRDQMGDAALHHAVLQTQGCM